MSTATPTVRPIVTPRWREQPRMLRQVFRDPTPVLDEIADRYDGM